MKIKNTFCSIAVIILVAGASFAQKPPTRSQTKFTSVYTNLMRDCRVSRGTNGTDDAGVCRGVGGYQVRIYSSAAAVHINVEIKGTDDSFSLATVGTDFDESKSRIEWRLADGKPFAVIIRVPEYGDPTRDSPNLGEVIGEELNVQGLKRFASLSFSIDAKESNANAKARELADRAYLESR